MTLLSRLVAVEGVFPRPAKSCGRGTRLSPLRQDFCCRLWWGLYNKPPHASSNCMGTIHSFQISWVLDKISKYTLVTRGPSSNTLFQQRWTTFGPWFVSRKLLVPCPKMKVLSVFHTGLHITVAQYKIFGTLLCLFRSKSIKDPISKSIEINVILKVLVYKEFEPLENLLFWAWLEITSFWFR